MTSLPIARGLLAVGIAAFSVACKKQIAGAAVDGAMLVRIQKLDAGSGGDRPLSALDTSGDGKLDASDWRPLDALRSDAVAAIKTAGVKVGPRVALYPGPAKDSADIFSLLNVKAGALDLSKVPVARLEELAVESGYIANQMRLATLHQGLPQARAFGGALVGSLAGYNHERMAPASVCVAIDAFDVAPYRALGMHATAILDLDSTVWEGNISDVFLAKLAESTVLKEVARPRLARFLKTLDGVDAATIDSNSVAQNAALMHERVHNRALPKPQRVSGKDAFYETVALLRGMTVAEVETLAMATLLEPTGDYPPMLDRVFDAKEGCGMRAVMAKLAGKGVRVYLLSATLDPLALAAGKHFGVPEERIMGSILEVKDGVYTGEVKDSTYYTKDAITRQWLGAPPTFAFGDSARSDFTMLCEAAVAAFMVNPRDDLLARDAKEAGSRIVGIWFESTEGELNKKP